MMGLFRKKKEKTPPPYDPSLLAAPSIPCSHCGEGILPGVAWACVATYKEGGRFDRNVDLHVSCVRPWAEQW